MYLWSLVALQSDVLSSFGSQLHNLLFLQICTENFKMFDLGFLFQNSIAPNTIHKSLCVAQPLSHSKSLSTIHFLLFWALFRFWLLLSPNAILSLHYAQQFNSPPTLSLPYFDSPRLINKPIKQRIHSRGFVICFSFSYPPSKVEESCMEMYIPHAEKMKWLQSEFSTFLLSDI